MLSISNRITPISSYQKHPRSRTREVDADFLQYRLEATDAALGLEELSCRGVTFQGMEKPFFEMTDHQ